MSAAKLEIAVEILRALGPVMTIAQTGHSIVARLSAGELTEEEARAQWAETQRQYKAGADAWDSADADR